MAIQLGALRDALLNPGDIERANRAAEEVAGYENRLAAIDTRLSVLQAGVGFMTLLLLALFWLTFGIRADLAQVRADVATIARQAAKP